MENLMQQGNFQPLRHWENVFAQEGIYIRPVAGKHFVSYEPQPSNQLVLYQPPQGHSRERSSRA
jgi:hypothetical protein